MADEMVSKNEMKLDEITQIGQNKCKFQVHMVTGVARFLCKIPPHDTF